MEEIKQEQLNELEKQEKQENKYEINVENLRRKIRKSEFSMKKYQFSAIRIIIIVLLVWILFFKIVGLASAPGGEMSPSIKSGDLLLFYRLDKSYAYRDVVVYKADPDESGKEELYVGRVIAAPGDKIAISDNGAVLVNDNALIEPDVRTATPIYGEFVEYPVELEAGEYFLLADDRMSGMDSRYLGKIDDEKIIGSVITLVRRHDI